MVTRKEYKIKRKHVVTTVGFSFVSFWLGKTVTVSCRLAIQTYQTNQSCFEPLNLENESSVNSDNFDATDLRF